MTNDLDGIKISVSPDGFHQYRHAVAGSKIPGVMTSHTVCHNKKIGKVSHRFFGNEHKVLIHFAFLTDIGCRKYPHVFLSCKGNVPDIATVQSC